MIKSYKCVKDTEISFLPLHYLCGGCHLFCSIRAALHPLVKSKIVKTRTKEFIRVLSHWYVKIKWNGQKSRGINNGFWEDLRARILFPTLVTGATRKPSLVASRSFWSMRSRSWRNCCSATNLTVLRSLTFTPKTTKEKGLHPRSSESPIPALGYAMKNMSMWHVCMFK